MEVPAMASGSPDVAPELDLMRPVRPAGKRASAKGARAAPAAASSARGKKTRSRAGAGRPRAEKAPATPAGKSLDRAQRALDQAAKTEKQLRASLKKHSKAVSAARDDLDRSDRELEGMKAQLKTAKKSRKRAVRELGPSAKPAAAKK
jgi:chromosome segregation ATPase